MTPGRFICLTVGFVLLVLAATSRPSAAQGGDGFLFREPAIQVGVRVGYAALLGPRSAGGTTDLYGFSQDLLTIDGGDWDGLSIAGELSFRVAPRFDVTVDFGQARSEVASEFRDWVDQDDLPIAQTTSFTRRPLNLGFRFFLADKGRRVSQFAWIPARLVPYVGAGVGSLWFDFAQDGDFVDFETLEVFSDRLETSGRANTAQLFGGLQYAMGKFGVLTAEARYRFGAADLGGDFVGFDDLDLSGLEFDVGLGFRF